MSAPRVRVADLRAAGVCPAARHWFAEHGLCWRSFVREGIPLAELEAVGSNAEVVARIGRAAAARQAREAGGGRR